MIDYSNTGKIMNNFFIALTRRKSGSVEGESRLDRCLTLLDLTALGVGGTLGLGVYVLAGAVAKTIAGPAVCLSFLVAAIASAVAGLCYAEFASRVPKAGSAYVYSYVSVGEFIAFIIGWNLILEYVIGTASVARGLTNYLDSLLNNQIRDGLTASVPINISFMSPYVDFLSFGFVMLLTVLLSIGVKESTGLNNIFTIVNLATIAIVVVSCIIKANPANWNIAKEDIPAEYKEVAGEGGFMPFGFTGIMAGAAKCFFGFVGFDGVATAGEEAKRPQKDIPLAVCISLFIVFAAYFSISTVMTLAWPYYLQDADAPLPYLYDQLGWNVIKWIVTIGAVFALCTSLLGAMFPLPRVLYAMSSDGLIFKILAKVHPKFQTPLLATILSGLLSGIMAAVFDLQQLIDMMSIGTLLAYTIVAMCVLILRYQPSSDSAYVPQLEKSEIPSVTLLNYLSKDVFNLNMNKNPSRSSSVLVNWCIGIFSILSLGFGAFTIYGLDVIVPSHPEYFIPFILVSILMCLIVVIIGRQPVEDIKLAFKVPFVPIIPCLSIVINLYLMLQLDLGTWIRFSVWLFIGFVIYFGYGLRHSEEGKRDKKCDVDISMKNTIHF